MPVWGVYLLNGTEVTTPDEEVWSPNVIGNNLNGLQDRSPCWILEWRKIVADPCRLDWHNYDNQQLESITTRPRDVLDEMETYTDARCQSVTMRQRRGAGNEIVATFLICI